MECLNCINSCWNYLGWPLLLTSYFTPTRSIWPNQCQLSNRHKTAWQSASARSCCLANQEKTCCLRLSAALSRFPFFCAAVRLTSIRAERAVHSGAPASEINAFAAQLSPIRPSTKMTCTKTINRRKFRSQTSDNMDRWKSRGEKSHRREEQKRAEKESEERRCRRAKK